MVSTSILFTSWASIFALIWLMILRVIPRNDLFVWGFMIIFLVLAFFAAAWIDSRKGEK